MDNEQLESLIQDLLSNNKESEWLEFKENFHSKEEIGERISAIANASSVHGKAYGYLIFGIRDKSYEVVGTSFDPYTELVGKEELENWVVQRLAPRIDFRIHVFDYKGKNLVLFCIPAAQHQPVRFMHVAYVRIGSYTRKLHDFPDKEAKIWNKATSSFEKEIAKDNLTKSDIIQYLSAERYFDLLKLPYPTTIDGVISKFIQEKFIVQDRAGFAITKLGALLLAKDLNSFESVARKSIRVIIYKGKNKVETVREQIGIKGYALGFEGLVDWINGQLPANEQIGKALREDTRMYPEIVIRELVANALIHQDLNEKGFPMIEIFSDRIEFSNPGTPEISPERFIDSYYSRNELLADIMRRMGFCEEKGSGLDKVYFYNELYQLPPIDFSVDEKRTKVAVFSYKELNKLDKKEKIRACYQHACLRHVSNDKLTNESLRERFGIEEKNSAIASRIIKDCFIEGLIKEDDPDSNSRKFKKYVPFWA